MTLRTRWIAAIVIAAAVGAIGWSKWHAPPPAVARASAVPSTTRDATSLATPPANDVTNAIRLQRTVNLGLTFDHRVVNGVGAANFLKAIKETAEGIEKPWKMKRSHTSARFSTHWKELLTVTLK